MLREISQIEKDKYYMYHLYTESKKYNKLVNVIKKKKRSRLTDIENKLVLLDGGDGKIEVGE